MALCAQQAHKCASFFLFVQTQYVQRPSTQMRMKRTKSPGWEIVAVCDETVTLLWCCGYTIIEAKQWGLKPSYIPFIFCIFFLLQVTYPKTDEQRQRLQEACKDILLFKNLDQVKTFFLLSIMFSIVYNYILVKVLKHPLQRLKWSICLGNTPFDIMCWLIGSLHGTGNGLNSKKYNKNLPSLKENQGFQFPGVWGRA